MTAITAITKMAAVKIYRFLFFIGPVPFDLLFHVFAPDFRALPALCPILVSTFVIYYFTPPLNSKELNSVLNFES